MVNEIKHVFKVHFAFQKRIDRTYRNVLFEIAPYLLFYGVGNAAGPQLLDGLEKLLELSKHFLGNVVVVFRFDPIIDAIEGYIKGRLAR